MVKQYEKYYTTNTHGYMQYEDAVFPQYIYDIIRRFVKNTNKNAIEIGAGMGRFTAPLVATHEKIHLIEPSKDYAEILNNKYKALNIEVFNESVKEYINKQRIPDDSACYIFHVLHHLSKPERMDMFLKLKKSVSHIIAVEPNPFNPLFLIQPLFEKDMKLKEEIGYIKLTKRALSSELESYGYKIEKYKRICFLPPFIANKLLHKSLFSKIVRVLDIFNGFFPMFGSYSLFSIKRVEN